jgi:tetratricopeptide (TPR) repeat protein
MKPALYLALSLLVTSYHQLDVMGQDTAEKKRSFADSLEAITLEAIGFQQRICQQNPSAFQLLMLSENQLDGSAYRKATVQFDQILTHLEKKRGHYSSDYDFLRHLFTYTQNRLFIHYIPYRSFARLMTHKEYNCVSGTGLYALILSHFGFAYSIIETPMHMYLLSEYTGKDGKQYPVLIESTARMQGLVTDQAQIQQKQTEYQQLDRKVCLQTSLCWLDSEQNCPPNFCQQIGLPQVSGLQYFNRGIVHYNQQRLKQALNCFQKASILYPYSKRIKSMIIRVLTLRRE